MEKMDPIKTAEKVRADLNGELDADLEKAMGDSGEEKASDKVVSAEFSEVKTTERVEEDKEVEKQKNRSNLEKLEKLEKEFDRLRNNPKERTEEVVIKLKEMNSEIIELKHRLKYFKKDLDIKEKMGEVDEIGESELVDKMEREKEAPKEELGETGDLELADKLEKEAKKEISPEVEAESGEGEKKESSSEKLEALSEELKKAREEYIKKDYDMDKKANKFLKAFGLGRSGLGEYEKEIENYKDSYEEALKNYKDAVVSSEHVGDKEDIEIATRGFVIGENLNRESIRADLEAKETGMSKALMKGFNRMMEGYSKQSFKKKLLIGAGIAGTGFALSAAGGVAAVGGVGIMAGYRIFTTGVSSVGFSRMAEAWAQKEKGKKEEKEAENIKNSRFEGSESDIELSYEKLKEALDKNIENVNSKIQRDKQWKVWRKYMGAGAGIGMSIAGRYLGKEIAEYFSGGTPEIENVVHTSPSFDDGPDGLGGSDEFREWSSADPEKWKPDWEDRLKELKSWNESRSVGLSNAQLEDVAKGHPRLDKFCEIEGKKASFRNLFAGAEDQTKDRGSVSTESGVNSEAIKEQVEQALHRPEFDTLGETVAGAETAEAVSGSEFPKGVTMDVAKGSSLEGTLKTFLAANSEKLTEGNMGWDAEKYSSVEEWAGKRAHIIAEEYAKANADQFPKGAPSLIHPGAEINLDLSNPADIQIDNINDPERLGYLEEKVSEAADAKVTEAATETATKQAEAPATEAPKMETPVETMSAVEMQNQQLAEMKIAHALGLNPQEYSAINDTNVGKLLSEMDKFQELGAKKYIPDLPHHGIYGNPERYDHARLAEFIKSQLNNVSGGDRLSVKEFLMKVDLESLPSDSTVMSKHFSFEDGAKYLSGVLRQETAETIKICANNNIEDWNNIKNVPVADSGANKVVENLRAAVSKTLPEGVAVPSKNDTVENWMIKVTKEAYKRGTLDELREHLAASRK